MIFLQLVHEVVILGRALDRGFARPRWRHGVKRAELIRAIGEADAQGGEGSALGGDGRDARARRGSVEEMCSAAMRL